MENVSVWGLFSKTPPLWKWQADGCLCPLICALIHFCSVNTIFDRSSCSPILVHHPSSSSTRIVQLTRNKLFFLRRSECVWGCCGFFLPLTPQRLTSPRCLPGVTHSCFCCSYKLWTTPNLSPCTHTPSQQRLLLLKRAIMTTTPRNTVTTLTPGWWFTPASNPCFPPSLCSHW